MAKDSQIQIRVESDIKQTLEENAKNNNFSTLSEYLIFVGLNAEIKVVATKKEEETPEKILKNIIKEV